MKWFHYAWRVIWNKKEAERETGVELTKPNSVLLSPRTYKRRIFIRTTWIATNEGDRVQANERPWLKITDGGDQVPFEMVCVLSTFIKKGWEYTGIL